MKRVKRIFCDVESIPSQRWDIVHEIVQRHTAACGDDLPKARKLIDEEHRKTALNGAFGEVVVVAWAVDDGPVSYLQRHYKDPAGEARVLAAFAEVLRREIDGEARTELVGHNILGFDRPFLRQRGIVCRVALPAIVSDDTIKPWALPVRDTMAIWCGSQRERISLDNLCRALGIPGKGHGLDGAHVWDAIQAGRIDDVTAYCCADVERVRACFNHIANQPLFSEEGASA